MPLVDALPDAEVDAEIDQGAGAATVIALAGPVLSVAVPVAAAVDALGATLTLTQDHRAETPPGPLVTVGPLPAAVTQLPDGTSTLQVTLAQPPDLIAGAVQVVAAYAVAGQPQPPLTVLGELDAGGPVDLDVPVSPPLVAIGSGGTLLQSGGLEWVHVLFSSPDRPSTDSATGEPVDLAQFPAWMAITRGAAQDADYVPASWLVRTAEPAGTYLRLLVGRGGALDLAPGAWRVYGKFTGPSLATDPPVALTYVRRAAGFLMVE